MAAWLLCRQHALRIAVPLAHVIETMRPLDIDAIGGAPSFVLGVSIVRGAPTPIVDAARLLGLDESIAPTRWIALRAGARRIALAVGAVEGVRALDDDRAAAPVPPLLSRARADVIDAISSLDAALLVVLRASGVLTDDDAAALRARGAIS
jgi:purine-binding chemotaxis protein CheW